MISDFYEINAGGRYGNLDVVPIGTLKGIQQFAQCVIDSYGFVCRDIAQHDVPVLGKQIPVGFAEVGYANPFGKVGDKVHIAKNSEGVRVLLGAVAPSHEVVACRGGGRHGGGAAVLETAAAGHSAEVVIVAENADCMLGTHKISSICHIVIYSDGLGVVVTTITPMVENVMFESVGSNGCLLAAVEDAAAGNASPFGVVANHREGELCVRFKRGSEGDVLCHRDHPWVGGAAVIPLHEVMMRSRNGLQDGLAAVLVGATAGNGALIGVSGCNSYSVGVGCKESLVGSILGDQYGTVALGVPVIPLGEVVAVQGGGCQHGGSIVVVSAAAGNHALCRVYAVHREGVAVGRKLCGIGGIVGDSHRTRVGDVAIRPLREVIAVIGGGRKSDSSVKVVGAAAGNRALLRIAVYSQCVVVWREESSKSGIVDNRYFSRADGHPVVPLYEVVAGKGRCRQNGRVPQVVGAAAAHLSHGGRAVEHGDGVLRQGEDGGVGGVARHGDDAGHLGVAVAPLYEAVAAVGRGGQHNLRAVVICAAPRYGTLVRVVGGHNHAVTIYSEMCGEGGVVGYHHIARIACVAVVPLGEVVARVGRGGNEHGSSVVVVTTSGYRSSRIVAGISHESMLVNGEDSGERQIVFGGDEARVLRVAVAPLHKMVVRGGGGLQGYRCVVILSSATGSASVVAVVRGNADIHPVGGEDSRK